MEEDPSNDNNIIANENILERLATVESITMRGTATAVNTYNSLENFRQMANDNDRNIARILSDDFRQMMDRNGKLLGNVENSVDNVTDSVGGVTRNVNLTNVLLNRSIAIQSMMLNALQGIKLDLDSQEGNNAIPQILQRGIGAAIDSAIISSTKALVSAILSPEVLAAAATALLYLTVKPSGLNEGEQDIHGHVIRTPAEEQYLREHSSVNPDGSKKTIDSNLSPADARNDNPTPVVPNVTPPAVVAPPPPAQAQAPATGGFGSGQPANAIATQQSAPPPISPEAVIPPSVPVRTSKVLQTNQQEAYAAARGQGMSDSAARILVANMSGESLRDPSNYHWDSKHYSQGIVQWDPERAARIKKQFGKEPRYMSVEEQTKAAIWEMKTFYESSWDSLTNDKMSAENRLYSVVKNYERPADARGATAQRLALYKSLKINGMSSPSDTEDAVKNDARQTPVPIGPTATPTRNVPGQAGTGMAPEPATPRANLGKFGGGMPGMGMSMEFGRGGRIGGVVGLFENIVNALTGPNDRYARMEQRSLPQKAAMIAADAVEDKVRPERKSEVEAKKPEYENLPDHGFHNMSDRYYNDNNDKSLRGHTSWIDDLKNSGMFRDLVLHHVIV